MVSVPARRGQVVYATGRGLSQRRACTLVQVGRSALHYRSRKAVKNAAVIARMQELSAQYPRYGYRRIRKALAASYDAAADLPSIEIVDVDMHGDRRLVLQHVVRKGRVLDALETRRVLRHIATLWGHSIVLREVDYETGRAFAEHGASAGAF